MKDLSSNYLYRGKLLASVTVKNNDNIIGRPIRVEEKPKMKDLGKLFEYRCFPYEQFNRKQLVEDMPGWYARLEIIKRT